MYYRLMFTMNTDTVRESIYEEMDLFPQHIDIHIYHVVFFSGVFGMVPKK